MAALLWRKQHEFRHFFQNATFDQAVTVCRIFPKRLSSTIKGKGTKSSGSKYKSTVLLPKTNFPLWLNPRQRSQHEHEVMERCRFASLYEWQRGALQGKEFVLHDGPPYANGTPHVGHVVNKVLKDIIMRWELLNGSRIHFVPGWDCHGLPIELKVINSSENSTVDGKEPTNSEIRVKARNFAKKAIQVQRSAFQSWGILGNWSDDCYYTYADQYVQNQLHSFYSMFEKGLIYRDLKPIHWSPSTRTALAEAELVYNKNHTSKSVIIRFQLITPPFNVKTDKPLYALVWTTTPWTLPANEAVLYKSDLEYCAIEIDNDDGCYIIADSLVPNLTKSLGKEIKILNKFLGKALRRVTYAHPFHKEEVHRFFEADHVSDDKGTGLVHCAPGHGREDYVIGLQNNLPIVSVADHEGNFSEVAGPALTGKHVLGDGTETVLELLQSDIIISEDFVHSYPYDWRTNKPVITLASQQWFFDCSSVKDVAINELKNVIFAPARYSNQSLAQLVKDRPFWCISRQRVWGVPVPVLFKRESSTPIISRSLIEHYCKLIDEHGTDFWWSLPIEQLCPSDLASELGVHINEIERCSDILDIWFDSGLSWLNALEDRTADLCLEGVDQFTGWFQSSLLTSVALRGKSPFKKIFCHGFVVDEDGHKMSKSLGNVINPEEIIVGGKNQDKQQAFGVDTLRWWVASHSVQHSNIPIGIPLIKEGSEIVQKLRGTLRYCLGALSDFPVAYADSIPREKLFLIDCYLLHVLHELQKDVQEMYNQHQYNLLCHTINEFVVNDVSALYFNITKDRLYCELADSNERRSCQFVIYQILGFLMRSLGPIVPLLVEEAYLHHPLKIGKKTYFEHQSQHPFVIEDKWHSSSTVEILEVALKIKSIVNKDLKSGQSWGSDVTIHVTQSSLDLLKPLVENQPATHSQLAEILQVGSVQLKQILQEENSPEQPFSCIVEATISDSALCCRCRRHKIQIGPDLCNRCGIIIQSNSHISQGASV